MPWFPGLCCVARGNATVSHREGPRGTGWSLGGNWIPLGSWVAFQGSVRGMSCQESLGTHIVRLVTVAARHDNL